MPTAIDRSSLRFGESSVLLSVDGGARCTIQRFPPQLPAGFGPSAVFLAYVPVDGFLPWLLAGWRFPRDVAQPMAGAHGLWSCMMELAHA